jgi:hypothetical protein
MKFHLWLFLKEQLESALVDIYEHAIEEGVRCKYLYTEKNKDIEY